MRIAHTCANCGFDLTRTPAPIDPVYGLPIVVCPDCRAAVVRREHPTMAWSRWMGRAAWSVCVLAIRIAFTLAIAGVIIGLAQAPWGIVRGVQFRGVIWARETLLVGGVVWLAASLIAGVWVGMMWVHWRSWQAALAWLCLLLSLPLLWFALMYMDAFVSSHHTPSVFRYSWNRALREMPSGYWMLLVAWGVSLLTLHAGRWMGARSIRRRRRAAWRRARTRRKQAWTSKLLLRA